jgi:hypothetical protein
MKVLAITVTIGDSPKTQMFSFDQVSYEISELHKSVKVMLKSTGEVVFSACGYSHLVEVGEQAPIPQVIPAQQSAQQPTEQTEQKEQPQS